MTRLLWLAPKWPWPAHCGSRQALVRLVEPLARKGVEIDLLAFIDRGQSVDFETAHRAGISQCFVVGKDTGLSGLAGRVKNALQAVLSESKDQLPFTLAPFGGLKQTRAVETLLADRTNYPGLKVSLRDGKENLSWDAVVFEGLHVAAALLCTSRRNFGRPGLKLIYRAQNCESALWERAAERSHLPLRPFMKSQAELVAGFERGLLHRIHALAAVSNTDLLAFERLAGDSFPSTLARQVVPVGFKFDDRKKLVNSSNLLFLGRLDWEPNRQGLIWLLDRVWPEVHRRRPDLELTVAGSHCPGALRRRLNSEPINFLGEVEDVGKLYEQCGASLVPIFFGGGTRVKAIESVAHGRALISTELGLEGLGLVAGRDYLAAQSEEEWRKVLAELNPSVLSECAANASRRLRADFDQEAAANNFIKLLANSRLEEAA